MLRRRNAQRVIPDLTVCSRHSPEAVSSFQGTARLVDLGWVSFSAQQCVRNFPVRKTRPFVQERKDLVCERRCHLHNDANGHLGDIVKNSKGRGLNPTTPSSDSYVVRHSKIPGLRSVGGQSLHARDGITSVVLRKPRWCWRRGWPAFPDIIIAPPPLRGEDEKAYGFRIAAAASARRNSSIAVLKIAG